MAPEEISESLAISEKDIETLVEKIDREWQKYLIVSTQRGFRSERVPVEFSPTENLLDTICARDQNLALRFVKNNLQEVEWVNEKLPEKKELFSLSEIVKLEGVAPEKVKQYIEGHEKDEKFLSKVLDYIEETGETSLLEYVESYLDPNDPKLVEAYFSHLGRISDEIGPFGPQDEKLSEFITSCFSDPETVDLGLDHIHTVMRRVDLPVKNLESILLASITRVPSQKVLRYHIQNRVHSVWGKLIEDPEFSDEEAYALFFEHLSDPEEKNLSCFSRALNYLKPLIKTATSIPQNVYEYLECIENPGDDQFVIQQIFPLLLEHESVSSEWVHKYISKSIERETYIDQRLRAASTMPNVVKSPVVSKTQKRKYLETLLRDRSVRIRAQAVNAVANLPLESQRDVLFVCRILNRASRHENKWMYKAGEKAASSMMKINSPNKFQIRAQGRLRRILPKKVVASLELDSLLSEEEIHMYAKKEESREERLSRSEEILLRKKEVEREEEEFRVELKLLAPREALDLITKRMKDPELYQSGYGFALNSLLSLGAKQQQLFPEIYEIIREVKEGEGIWFKAFEDPKYLGFLFLDYEDWNPWQRFAQKINTFLVEGRFSKKKAKSLQDLLIGEDLAANSSSTLSFLPEILKYPHLEDEEKEEIAATTFSNSSHEIYLDTQTVNQAYTLAQREDEIGVIARKHIVENIPKTLETRLASNAHSDIQPCIRLTQFIVGSEQPFEDYVSVYDAFFHEDHRQMDQRANVLIELMKYEDVSTDKIKEYLRIFFRGNINSKREGFELLLSTYTSGRITQEEVCDYIDICFEDPHLFYNTRRGEEEEYSLRTLLEVLDKEVAVTYGLKYLRKGFRTTDDDFGLKIFLKELLSDGTPINDKHVRFARKYLETYPLNGERDESLDALTIKTLEAMTKLEIHDEEYLESLLSTCSSLDEIVECNSIDAGEHLVTKRISDKGSTGNTYLAVHKNYKHLGTGVLKIYEEDANENEYSRNDAVAFLRSELKRYFVEVLSKQLVKVGGKIRKCLFMKHGGKDLFTYIQEKGPLDTNLAITYFTTIVHGCYVLHKKFGISHEDIRPENIFIDEKELVNETPVLRLGDLGIAGEEHGSDKNTRFGPPMGFHGESPDIFAAGAILYFMLTGEYLLCDRTERMTSLEHRDASLDAKMKFYDIPEEYREEEEAFWRKGRVIQEEPEEDLGLINIPYTPYYPRSDEICRKIEEGISKVGRQSLVKDILIACFETNTSFSKLRKSAILGEDVFGEYGFLYNRDFF